MFSLLLGVIGVDDLIIGAVVGSALGAGGGFMSSWLGNKNSKKQAKREAELNYQYALRMAENGPSASVAGLRKANLNPILAATDGAFSTPSMPSVHADNSNDGSSGMSAGMQAANMALQARQIGSNVETQDTVQQVNKASAFRQFVDGLTKLRQGGYKDYLGVGYQGLQAIGKSLGLTNDESSDVLKMFGFDPLSKSVPNGSEKPTAEVKSRHHPMDKTLSDHPVVKEFTKNDDKITHKIEDFTSGAIPVWYRRWQDHNERSREVRRKEYRLKHAPKRNRNSNFWYYQ